MSAEPSGVASLYLFFSGLFGIGFAIGGLVALIWLIIVLINTNTYLKLLIHDRKNRKNITLVKEEEKPFTNPEK
jgi:predicted membrane protein